MEVIHELVPWTKLFLAIQIPLWVIMVFILLVLIVFVIFKHRLVPYISQLARNKADLKTIALKARLMEKEKMRLQNEADAYKRIYTATLALDRILGDFHVVMHMVSGCGNSVEERGTFLLQLDREVIGKWGVEVSEAFGLLNNGELVGMIQDLE